MRDLVRGFYAVLEGPNQQLLEWLIEGGAQVIQVRMKKVSSRQLFETAELARELTREAGVALVINDRLDVALAVGADGVHLGQDDLPLPAAREAIRLAGRQLAIGISTHSVAQAIAAARGGADYLGFGPVYRTSTKDNPDPVQGVAALAEAVRSVAPVPIVAIGGVTPERAGELAAAGAAAACAISSVNGAKNVAEAARMVAAAFA